MQKVKGIQPLAHYHFFLYGQNSYRHRGASWKLAAQRAALPGKVLSLMLCPLAPLLKRSLRSIFWPEPLGCGQDQTLGRCPDRWESLSSGIGSRKNWGTSIHLLVRNNCLILD
jgi:hypothetical protein